MIGKSQRRGQAPGPRGAASARPALVATYILYALAPLTVNAAPAFLDVAGSRLALSGAETGLLAAVEATGGLIASVTAPFWIGRVRWRPAIVAASLVMVLGFAAMPLAHGFAALAILRVLASILGAGIVYSVTIAHLSSLPHAERHFALAGVGQAALAALVTVAVPAARSYAGHDGAYLCFAAVALASPVAAMWFHSDRIVMNAPAGAPSMSGWMPDRAGLALLLSALLLPAGGATYWAFADSIGRMAGLSDAAIAQSVSFALVTGVLGSVVAATAVRRFAVLPLYCAGAAVAVGAMWGVAAHPGAASFALSNIAVNFIWIFLTPLQMGAMAGAARGPLLAVLGPGAQSAGVMIGPAMVGQMVGTAHFVVAIYAAIALVGTSVAAFALGLLPARALFPAPKGWSPGA